MRIYLILIGLLFSTTVFAQKVDYAITGTVASSFNSLYDFSEGFARVEKQGYGFINSKGQDVIAAKFSEAGDFHCGMAYVAIEDSRTQKTLYGYINKDGKQLIACQFEDARDFSCGRAAVKKNGQWQYIDQHGQMVLNNSFIRVDSLIDRMYNGAYNSTEVKPRMFKNGLLLVSKGGKFGYVDTTGKTVIPFQYDHANDFAEGIAIVSDKTIKSEPMTGNDALSKLYNDLPTGPSEHTYKAIDVTGKTLFVIDKDMKGVTDFSDGMALFYKEGEDSQLSLWGFINKSGKVVFPGQFENEPKAFSGGIGFVQVNGKQEQNKDGLICTLDTLGNVTAKISLCDAAGLCMFDSSQLFSEGLLSVKIGDEWGYMDKTGKLIIKPQFRTAKDFHDGLAVVELETGKLSIIKNPLKTESK